MLTNAAIIGILDNLFVSEKGFVPVKQFDVDGSKEKAEMAFVFLVDSGYVATVIVGDKDDKDPKDKNIFARLTWKGLEAVKILSFDKSWKEEAIRKKQLPFDTLVEMLKSRIRKGW